VSIDVVGEVHVRRPRNHVRGGGGLFSLGSPLFAPFVRRNVQKDLERMRDVLEG
jgi:hypothetical protein